MARKATKKEYHDALELALCSLFTANGGIITPEFAALAAVLCGRVNKHVNNTIYTALSFNNALEF